MSYCDLYFTGGSSSFAYRFKREFPTYESDDGTVKREVPIAMVALVATGVSPPIVSDLYNLVLMCFISSMPLSKNGIMEGIKLWTSLPMRFLTSMMAMSTCSTMSSRIVETLSML
jgi:hypothetical protein